MNAVYGGIHPLHASRLHHQNIPRAVGMALREAGLGMQDIDAVAYTRGPGMRGCLNVCATAAKTLAAVHEKPLAGVHHMQAHALTPLLTESQPPAFPFLVALVSGGHTQLVLAKTLHSFKIIADCEDAKIGQQRIAVIDTSDAFDKIARLLHLPPSPTQGFGAVLEQYASLPLLPPFDTVPLPTFTVPFSSGLGVHSLKFSFSGIISSVERYIRQNHPSSTPIGDRITGEGDIIVSESTRRAVSRAFQETAVKHLCQKTKLALSMPELKNVKSVVLSGGVASNLYLRDSIRKTLDELNRSIHVFYPPVALCTDNAAMIAWTAILRIQDGDKGERDDLPVRPKWSIEDLGVDESGRAVAEDGV